MSILVGVRETVGKWKLCCACSCVLRGDSSCSSRLVSSRGVYRPPHKLIVSHSHSCVPCCGPPGGIICPSGIIWPSPATNVLSGGEPPSIGEENCCPIILASPISVSCPIVDGAGAIGFVCNVCLLLFAIADLALLALRDGIGATELAGTAGFGGPGAIDTTPFALGVAPDDVVELGDSESCGIRCGIGAGGATREFLRDAFLPTDLVLLTCVAPLPRLRFLITSVLRDRGRTTPWSFRNRPHALHSGFPSGFRRHKGVV